MSRSVSFLGTAAFLLLALVASSASSQLNGSLNVNPGQRAGATPGGQVLLYSPEPIQGGSSISHWDTSLTPNALMEPFINADLPFLGLDLTPALMEDIGWPRVQPGQPSTTAVRLFSLDPPGVGFDDPRPFPGAPANNATTLGEARVNLFAAILGTWAGDLLTNQNIDVLVTWTPLFCQGGAATLAAAGTTLIFSDDGSVLPRANTWYHASLAEAIAGQELTGPPELGGDGDIIVFMNSEIDNECLAPGTGYFYGLDGSPAPGNQLDVSAVVLHEIGHGLGMSNFTTETNGEFIQGLPGIYDHFTLDTTTGQDFTQLTAEERVDAAAKSRRIAWSGANVTAAAPGFLDPGTPRLTINSPASLAGDYPIGTASFGPSIETSPISGDIACMLDGTVPGSDSSPLNGCGPATNPGELAGKIALISRGDCSFATKVTNAEAAGAIGAIIVNNAGGVFGLGGSGPDITIPSVGVDRRDGNAFRQAACPGAAGFVTGDRFQVVVEFDNGKTSGLGVSSELTPNSEWTYFFNPENPETIVKVLNGCGLNDHFWIFAAGLTNVEVTLTVTDTATGQSRSYDNPLGKPFQPIQDTQAFATCP